MFEGATIVINKTASARYFVHGAIVNLLLWAVFDVVFGASPLWVIAVVLGGIMVALELLWTPVVYTAQRLVERILAWHWVAQMYAWVHHATPRDLQQAVHHYLSEAAAATQPDTVATITALHALPAADTSIRKRLLPAVKEEHIVLKKNPATTSLPPSAYMTRTGSPARTLSTSIV